MTSHRMSVSRASAAEVAAGRRIGDLGFCNCKRLTDLTIPGSVTEIGRDAFYMCRDLTLTVPEGSYAEQYAKENEIPYKQ